MDLAVLPKYAQGSSGFAVALCRYAVWRSGILSEFLGGVVRFPNKKIGNYRPSN